MRDVNLFASASDDSAAALSMLASLVRAQENIVVLQVPDIAVAPGLAIVQAAKGVQMVAPPDTRFEYAVGDIVRLRDADAREMLALATLTVPGPYLARTHVMGRFIGMRIGGRLAAMAGERMRFPGWTELSGVCTHPEFRGRGLARQLSAAVASRIQGRGDQVFLHAWKSNEAAICLYESLGFRLRTEVNVEVLGRIDPRGISSVAPMAAG